MRKCAGLALLTLAALAPSTAHAGVVSLPPVERSLSADSAQARDCAARIAQGASGVATTTYTAPMSGYANVRLAAAGGDWDLALFDASTGRRVGSSAGFGAAEVAQTWIGSGERLVVQACRRSGDAATARAAVELLDIEPPKAAGTPMLARVAFDSRKDLERLEATGVDVTHHIHDGKADVIVAGTQQLTKLRELGFDADVEIANLTDHYAQARRADAAYGRRVVDAPTPSGRTNYRTYADIQNELKTLAEGNPEIVKPITLPRRSFQGREVQGLEIAHKVHRPADGRPVYLLVATHHAREWPSAEAAMEFAHMLVQGYGQDQRISKLMRKSRVIVVPLINPDGYVSSRGAVDPVDLVTNQGTGNGTGVGVNPNLDDLDEDGGQDAYDCQDLLAGCDTRLSIVPVIGPPGGMMAYRRKNCDGAVPDGRVPCELQWGVDPNRNYGYNWGGPGSSGEVMSQSYRGTGPWSEPETKNVHELSQGLPITNIVTLHNVAALVLRPPGVSDEGLAPDETALKAIGDAMGEAAGYESQYSYQLYDTSGTTEDWNYAQQGAFGYTIEIGPKDGEFHMPYETGFVKQWTGEYAGNEEGLREALLIGWEAAADPAHHAVISGEAPKNRVLRAKKSFDTVTKPTCRTDHGIAPLNSEAIYGLEADLLGEKPCADPLGPVTVADGLDTTLSTTDSSTFEWHLPPSTRPFVAKPQEGVRPVLDEEQVEGPATPMQPPPTAGANAISNIEHEFTLAAGQEPAALRVELGWGTPGEDYDMYLFHEKDGQLVPIGKGRSTAEGQSASASRPEWIDVLEPPAGRYVVRITNWGAVTNEWLLKVQQLGAPETLPGEREAWTVTCETPDGDVLATREIEVDRGGRVAVDFSSSCVRSQAHRDE